MIPHCTAAALVSENKVLCHPSTVDRSQHPQHRKIMSRWVLGLLEVASCRGKCGESHRNRTHGSNVCSRSHGLKSTNKVESVKRMVREQVPFWERDQIANVGMDACWSRIREGRVLMLYDVVVWTCLERGDTSSCCSSEGSERFMEVRSSHFTTLRSSQWLARHHLDVWRLYDANRKGCNEHAI